MIHSFFFSDPTKGFQHHIKITAKNRRGDAEIKIVTMAEGDVNQTCIDISTCVESIDDLMHKLHFRRQFLKGERRHSRSTTNKLSTAGENHPSIYSFYESIWRDVLNA